MKPRSLNLFKTLIADESGQDMIEYVLVAALIALGSITAMSTLSQTISNAFTSIGTGVATSV